MGNFTFLPIRQSGVPLSGPMVMASMLAVSNVRDDKRLCGEELAYSAALSFFETVRVIRDASISAVEKGLAEGDRSSMGFYNESTYPLLYLCRHSIELLLKSVLFHQNCNIVKIHNLELLFRKVDQTVFPDDVRTDIMKFIRDLDKLDEKGEIFRYNFGEDGTPADAKKSYCVNLNAVVANTKTLFNVVCKYVFNKKLQFNCE